MNTQEDSTSATPASIETIYDDWHINTGGETIYAKRVQGKFRRLKWLSSSIWLIFFLGPYFQWHGNQAILWDIPNRKFHLFGIIVWPQDVWMLSLVLLFFAILLAVVTTLAGRVFCGYFCFQTAWTDVFTLIEEWVEGPPQQRRKLANSPWSFQKFKTKAITHSLWLLVSALTGISFIAWFVGASEVWHGIFTLSLSGFSLLFVALFTVGTYTLAGFLREQACFWLCPYARLQGVMYDRATILPVYDVKRGEPRGHIKKGGHANPQQGDCVDCGQCVAVCPTGIDIRNGQQEGCITCALCIDACDAVMEKVGKPVGLVRYASLDELEGVIEKPFFRRPRVLIYFTVLLVSIVGIVYGLATIAPIGLNVIHERQPLYVKVSDGSIQNKYTLKILNKTDQVMHIEVTATGPDGLQLAGFQSPVVVEVGRVMPFTVLVRIPPGSLTGEFSEIAFQIRDIDHPKWQSEYRSMFVGPPR